MELESLEAPVRIKLYDGTPFVMGRRPELRVANRAVSRQHCTIFWRQQPVDRHNVDRDEDGADRRPANSGTQDLLVEITAHRPTFVQPALSGVSELCQIRQQFSQVWWRLLTSRLLPLQTRQSPSTLRVLKAGKTAQVGGGRSPIQCLCNHTSLHSS